MSFRNNQPLWKRIMKAAIGVTLALSLTACGNNPPADTSKIVATYKGGQITQNEMDHEFKIQRLLVNPSYPSSNEYKDQFLHEYITLYKIIVPEAKKEGISVDKSKVDGMVQNFKQRLIQVVYQNDPKALEDEMKKLGVTDDDIRNWALDTMYVDNFRTEKVKNVTLTDAQLQTYYNQHKDELTTVTVDHILVKTEAEAKQVEAQLKAGANFAELAKKVSIDPSAKTNGGQFKDANPSQFVPEFKNACLTLPIGQISDPVHTQYGYHIMKVESRKVPTKEEVRANALEDAQATTWNTYLQQTEKDADIKVTLPADKQSNTQNPSSGQSSSSP
jgi:foldase protein PrsA